MPLSTVTSKGQTTIPKEIRNYLKLKPKDKIVYIPRDKDKVILKAVHGTVLGLRGAFPIKGKLNFEKLRRKMQKEIAKGVLKEMR